MNKSDDGGSALSKDCLDCIEMDLNSALAYGRAVDCMVERDMRSLISEVRRVQVATLLAEKRRRKSEGGDILIFLANYCVVNGFDMDLIARRTLKHVIERDVKEDISGKPTAPSSP